MVNQKLKKMKVRLKHLQKELRNIGPIMRGSVVYIGSVYKKYYFSVSMCKKTQIIYLGRQRAKYAKEYADNYKKLLDIIEEMTIIYMKLMKKKVLFNAFFS